MHVMAAMRLIREAGDLQVGSARLGGAFDMAGSALANNVSTLAPVRAYRSKVGSHAGTCDSHLPSREVSAARDGGRAPGRTADFANFEGAAL